MDTAMDYIGRRYSFNGRRRRGRCFGHILNLAAKALLDPVHSNDDDSIAPFIEDNVQLTAAQYEIWRKQGPVGKLRILVIAVDQSDRLHDLFIDCQNSTYAASPDPLIRSKKPLELVKDNQTRWLGTYYMIKRAIQLRHYMELARVRFQQVWSDENRGSIGNNPRPSAKIPPYLQPNNQLTDADWEALGRIELILKDFADCLIKLEGDGQIRLRSYGFEGSHGNISDYLLGFEFILEQLEGYRAEAEHYPDPVQYRVGINAAWAKITSYYEKLSDTPIYYAAHIFHPAQRWGSLEEMWAHDRQWVREAKKMIKGVWETEYKGLDLSNPRPTTPAHAHAKPPVHRSNNSFLSFIQRRRERTTETPFDDDEVRDEYTRWQNIDLEPGDKDVKDPVAYWHAHRVQYPKLSRMALDFLTIQAMSAECERLFSAAGRLQTQQRSTLDIKIVAKSMALRSWFKAGIVRNVDPMMLSVTEEAERHLLIGMDHEKAAERATMWLRTESVEDMEG